MPRGVTLLSPHWRSVTMPLLTGAFLVRRRRQAVTLDRLTGRELGRSLAMRSGQFAWFLGAGASASAGIPTASEMILDFKARLFCDGIGVPRREIDPSDPVWQERIESYLDGQHGFPSNGHPDEYGVAFEKAFPTEAERRRRIDDAVKRGQSSFGHRVLAAMIASRQAPCLFTTNFDPLIERAAVVADELLAVEQRAHLTVAALDSADRARRCLQESNWPLLVKLHGDYQSEELKNTRAELQAQDSALRKVLIGGCNRFGLLVVGYSGRDASVMGALREALRGTPRFPAGIRWVIRPGRKILPGVIDFLTDAVQAGVDAKLVESETFDELAGDIDRHASFPVELAAHVRDARPSPIVQPVTLPTTFHAAFPTLRCSALPVLATPAVARVVRIERPITTPDARSAIKAAKVSALAVARGQEVRAFGADEDLLVAFDTLGAALDGTIPLDPVSDSVDLGLVYDALARALTRGRPLRPIFRSGGHSIVVTADNPNRTAEQRARDRERLAPLKQAYGGALTGIVPGGALPFAEGVKIRMEHHAAQWWCVFDPFTWIDFPRRDATEDEEASDATWIPHQGDPVADWRRERWATRYNRSWAALLDAWACLLVSGPEDSPRAIGLRDQTGVDAAFRISRTTAWSRPATTAPGAWSG